MAYYHSKSKLVYLATPKTGSRATARALQEIGFERTGGHHGGLEDVEGSVKSAATAIRDPKDILASWTRQNIKPSMTPEEIAKNEIDTNAWVDENGRVAHHHLGEATEVLRYENGLESEVNKWLSNHGLPSIGLNQVGGSTGSLTESQWEVIKNHTREERIKLNYIDR